jgi:hypothetical protein
VVWPRGDADDGAARLRTGVSSNSCLVLLSKVQTQYVSHFEVDGEEGKRASLPQWRLVSQKLAKRQLGLEDKTKDQPQRKRRRLKTFQTMMSLSNMLRQMTGRGLERFYVPRNEAGKFTTDPFEWPHCNAAVDQGPDNMAMDHFVGYGPTQLNFHSDWDLTHGAHNDAVKETLKQCGLWRHILQVMSAMNSAYGSTMSPPRLAQIREAAQEYMENVDYRSDPWFNHWLPHIARHMSDLAAGDEDLGAQVWSRLKEAPLLWYKNIKVNVGKYMVAIKRSREDVPVFVIKALLYGYACYQLGYRMKKVCRKSALGLLGSGLFSFCRFPSGYTVGSWSTVH